MQFRSADRSENDMQWNWNVIVESLIVDDVDNEEHTYCLHISSKNLMTR